MSRYIDADTMIKAMPPIMEWLSKKAQTIDIDLADDGTLSVEVEDATKVKRVLVEDGKYGDLYYADRPQGDWEIVAQGWHSIRRCSNCKWTQSYSDPKYIGYEYNFCPNCGSKMKGAIR